MPFPYHSTSNLKKLKDRQPENEEDVKLAFKEATEANSLSIEKRIEKYYAAGVSESEGDSEEDKNNNDRKQRSKIMKDEKPSLGEDNKENIATVSLLANSVNHIVLDLLNTTHFLKTLNQFFFFFV